MKKNTYFIVTAAIVIMFSLYNILFANDLITNIINTFSELSDNVETNYFQQIIDIYKNNGEKIIVTNSIISIIASIGIILLSIKDNFTNYKGILIFLTIIIFLTGENNIINILSAINIIILINLKSYKPKEKKKIPQILYEKATTNKKICAILLILFYFSQIVWGDYIPRYQLIYWITVITFDLMVLSLAIAVFYQELKEGFNYFKENTLVYIKYLLAKYGIGLLIYFITSIIVMLITKQETSVNQSILETLPLWYIIPSTIIWAPLVEEIIFRGAIRRFIPNNKVFIVVSALIFGYLHAMSEASIINIVYMTLPYAVLGGLLAYIYVKTNNIIGNIVVHALHNSIAVLVMISTL